MTRRLPLSIVLAVATFAFARSLSSPTGTVLGVLALATAVLSTPVDPSLERLARLLGRVAVIAAVLVGWALAVAPMLHGERADDVMRTIGFALVGCALPLAVHAPRADAAVLLHALGLLGLAGLHRQADLRPFVAIAAVATALHLVVRAREVAVGRGRPPLVRLALAFGLVAAIATPVGLGLPPLQRRIEQAISGRRTWELRGRTGLSAEDVRVGEILSLAQSERAVLRFYGPRAQKLRAQVFVRFDGRLWHAVHATNPTTPPPVTATLGPRAAPWLARFDGPLRLFPGASSSDLGGDEVLASRLEPIELDEGLIVQPGDALAVATEDDVRIDAVGLLVRNDRRQPDPYVVVHRRRLGIGDAVPPTEAERALALSLPRLVDPRLRELANRLARAEGGGPAAPLLDPRQRVDRTVAYLRSAATYTLETPKYTGRDVVADFLFVHRAGYCEHFASALAILLRLEGVPTRYVTGFSLDENDREGEHYLVRDQHAHAWVEAFVDGVGWVEADATPVIEGEPGPRRGRWLDRLRAFIADLRADLRYGRAVDLARRLRWPLAITLSLLGLAYVARNEVRRRLLLAGKQGPKARAREPLTTDLETCLHDLEAAWRQLGVPRPRAAGLREHAETTETELPVEVARAVNVAVGLLHDAAFGGQTPEPAAIVAARAHLRALGRA
ncbi:MAG: hypothetical protein IPJ34_15975 [Myxococcales bacterium]|nr:hypothetical protein [Myxococcales bacterium]